MAKKVAQHPGSEGNFDIIKGTKATAEPRSNKQWGVAPAPKSAKASMKRAKQAHKTLARAAHAHTAVNPEGTASKLKGSGDFGSKALAARIRIAKVRTGITPRGSNLVESEPYSGEVNG
ncbi:MAG TPA: hypothetical protein VH558_06760 [Pseudolabrys sp.]|jgi:hypothetical protein